MGSYTAAELEGMGYVVDGDRLVRKSEPAAAPDESPDVTWQEMQRQCYRVFHDAGCEVYWLSQSRKTRQTAGLPDLLVFGPPGEPFHLAWETKAGRGGPSEAQRKFALHCHRTGFPYRIGNARMARRVLHELTTHSDALSAREDLRDNDPVLEYDDADLEPGESIGRPAASNPGAGPEKEGNDGGVNV